MILSQLFQLNIQFSYCFVFLIISQRKQFLNAISVILQRKYTLIYTTVIVFGAEVVIQDMLSALSTSKLYSQPIYLL